MDWDDLRFALALARAGNMARASRTLGVAHTTVARRIATFEAALGVSLFDRASGDVSLTPAGEDLLSTATEIEERVEAFERRLSSRHAELEGDVTIATIEPLATKIAETAIAFRRMHPAIRIHVNTTYAMVDLAKREADIALRVTGAPDESLVGRKLGNVAFAVYGVRKRVVEGAPWICFDESLASTPQGRWEAVNVPSEQIVMRTNSRGVFIEALRADAGIGILPCGVAAQLPDLVALTEPIRELAFPLWLLTHADLHKTPRIRTVLAFVADALEAEKHLIEGRPPAGSR
jgi:DNA-binding transcriptional LysR family regulator